MQRECQWALKEWAVVCAALAEGKQMLLLRKGGIAEGPLGFQIKQPDFLLLPTRFHQSADELQPSARPWIDQAVRQAPPPGELHISLYAEAAAVAFIDREERLRPLIDLQILSEETVLSRFHYRRPGLFAILLRVYRREDAWIVPDLPRYAGCRSWVELDAPLSTAGLTPVLPPADYNARADELSVLGEWRPPIGRNGP